MLADFQLRLWLRTILLARFKLQNATKINTRKRKKKTRDRKKQRNNSGRKRKSIVRMRNSLRHRVLLYDFGGTNTFKMQTPIAIRISIFEYTNRSFWKSCVCIFTWRHVTCVCLYVFPTQKLSTQLSLSLSQTHNHRNRHKCTDR